MVEHFPIIPKALSSTKSGKNHCVNGQTTRRCSLAVIPQTFEAHSLGLNTVSAGSQLCNTKTTFPVALCLSFPACYPFWSLRIFNGEGTKMLQRHPTSVSPTHFYRLNVSLSNKAWTHFYRLNATCSV